MTTGWMIGVLVEGGGAKPVRQYYAVAKSDRAQAEWAAVDSALTLGPVAASPVAGQEPVQAVAPLTAGTLAAMGLSRGQVRALGWRWPRRWIGQP